MTTGWICQELTCERCFRALEFEGPDNEAQFPEGWYLVAPRFYTDDWKRGIFTEYLFVCPECFRDDEQTPSDYDEPSNAFALWSSSAPKARNVKWKEAVPS